MLPPSTPTQIIERTVREEWGRILASLIKTLGDFQRAEDCLHDAVEIALSDWQRNGLPRSPEAWLLTTARRKAIDRIRREKSFAGRESDIAYLMDLEQRDTEGVEPDEIPDKRLEMIFTCCHPSLEEKTRVALTLQTLCGLTTEEIACAFLDKPEAMAQRLVRAKKKIAAAAIPYEIPARDVLAARLAAVLRVIYLIFNEGYSASSGPALVRSDLSDEAIRLARIVRHLMPDETEASGLLALVLLHDSRRFARCTSDGAMIALEHQNRARWDKPKIVEGSNLLKEALAKGRIGPYQLQAAISALHAESPSWVETDWPQIEALYELLYAIEPSPVIRVNQAVAVSYARTPKAALAMIDDAAGGGALDSYQPYFAARADLLARMKQAEAAGLALQKAIALTSNESEKRFLETKRQKIVLGAKTAE